MIETIFNGDMTAFTKAVLKTELCADPITLILLKKT
jgi:hypothetical protein